MESERGGGSPDTEEYLRRELLYRKTMKAMPDKPEQQPTEQGLSQEA